jgi:hypothetical protein
MNVPTGPGTSRKHPLPEAEAELLKESIGVLRGEVVPGRRTVSGWPLLRIVRRTRTDWALFHWVPQEPKV